MNKGVQTLLDAIVDYLPCPLDRPPITGTDLQGIPQPVHAVDDAPFAGLAFKIMTDPFVGTLTFTKGKLAPCLPRMHSPPSSSLSWRSQIRQQCPQLSQG